MVNSRFSIVMAAAKRARQIIAGKDDTITAKEASKPLSTAVKEIREGKVKILPAMEGDEDEDILIPSPELFSQTWSGSIDTEERDPSEDDAYGEGQDEEERDYGEDTDTTEPSEEGEEDQDPDDESEEN